MGTIYSFNLDGLCNTLGLNLNLLQKRRLEYEKRRHILTILLPDKKHKNFYPQSN